VLITHIPSQITQFVELASLLVNYPLLCKARLMKRQPKGINSYRRMQQLVDRAIPLAQALELTDMDKKLLRCRHVKDFSLLVNRLQKQASSLVLERLATVAMDDLGQVLTHIGPLLNDYEREQVERYWFASCPPLAFANSKTIIQLNSFQALFIDAHQQNHCGVTYWGDMRAGDFALFTVLAPQRAALALSRSASDQAFQIDQLVGRNNCAVSKKTWQVVKGWFKQAFV
jgi:hypothetical protein